MCFKTRLKYLKTEDMILNPDVCLCPSLTQVVIQTKTARESVDINLIYLTLQD